ncbi:hypothetical protein JRO89_XS04G0254500 [Xanthoceras sorbifolium]|uniref:Uncharacterized protein n=1 Tax=Xanthoceras sorbifolium TaxID=99658 RepID=A0ABQ8I789_9ROSI|nr:hypothetical protein JRO89_XS04G0254500 [Xanthoceras sorbifolium]
MRVSLPPLDKQASFLFSSLLYYWMPKILGWALPNALPVLAAEAASLLSCILMPMLVLLAKFTLSPDASQSTLHDWDKLKSMLLFQLKQVLAEYPEAKMPTEQQNASLGETYPELLKRLDEGLSMTGASILRVTALLCFTEGPPFTLQRLCEILLAARSIYPNLSKLALALEKNLLVTSMLTPCTDPYPQRTQTPVESDEAREETQLHSNSVENGAEPQPMVDGDEVMAEVEETDIDDEMTIDMEEMVGPSEKNATPTENS